MAIAPCAFRSATALLLVPAAFARGPLLLPALRGGLGGACGIRAGAFWPPGHRRPELRSESRGQMSL